MDDGRMTTEQFLEQQRELAEEFAKAIESRTLEEWANAVMAQWKRAKAILDGPPPSWKHVVTGDGVASAVDPIGVSGTLVLRCTCGTDMGDCDPKCPCHGANVIYTD